MKATTCAALVLSALSALSTAFAEDPTSYLRSSSTQRDLQVELPNHFCWVPFFGCERDNCETVTPLAAGEFNLTKYTEKSWFIQKQQVNPYQSEDQLNCVVATYNERDDGFIQVQNSGTIGGVDGPRQNSDSDSFFSDLCAQQVDGGSLQVAPCLFQVAFSAVAGPYWVLALGEDGDEYTWAIVSGGQPTEVKETVDGRTFCTTKQGNSFLDTNGSGLWLFTKEQVADDQTIAAMEDKLTEMGIFTGDLLPVEQESCTYPDSTKY
ncbi:expressed unknown protein [Seminavis robusta]|uniref:Lipocalin/cytosolic fatty-acid binding domain-containing protein n=1 Tax=Seminavis robusta TaxID=568900 RepID=A0A9N8H798_9STRA|nr:expressed unknown protein [Seminavis robusta]|eukprot:Sro134_g063610.1 n/a (265) ;mRNA; r:101667-102461